MTSKPLVNTVGSKFLSVSPSSSSSSHTSPTTIPSKTRKKDSNKPKNKKKKKGPKKRVKKSSTKKKAKSGRVEQEDEFGAAEVQDQEEKDNNNNNNDNEDDDEKTEINRKPVKIPDYAQKILEDERPDLIDANTDFSMDELIQLDQYLKAKVKLNRNDYVYVEDNKAEKAENRKFTRYRVMLHQDEGRFSSIYLCYKESRIAQKLASKSAIMKTPVDVEKKDKSDKKVKVPSKEPPKEPPMPEPNITSEVPYILKTSIRFGSRKNNFRCMRERRLYKILNDKKCDFIPQLYDYGVLGDSTFLVLESLGENLLVLSERVKLNKQSIMYIAARSFLALKSLHLVNFVYRDVKLTNFCIGVGKKSKHIYMFDFGEAVEQKKDIMMGPIDGYVMLYLSIEAHKNKKASMTKCDIESWFYMIIDLLQPELITWRKVAEEQQVIDLKTTFWTNLSEISEDMKPIGEAINKADRVFSKADYIAIEQVFNQIAKRDGLGLNLNW